MTVETSDIDSQLDERRNKGGGGARIAMRDSRVSSVFQWVAGVAAVVCAASAISMVGLVLDMRTDIAVLKTQASNNAPAITSLNSKVDGVQRQVTDLQITIGIIQDRQAQAQRNVSR